MRRLDTDHSRLALALDDDALASLWLWVGEDPASALQLAADPVAVRAARIDRISKADLDPPLDRLDGDHLALIRAIAGSPNRPA